MPNLQKVEKTPLALLMAEKFPGMRPPKTFLTQAGRKLKAGDVESAIEILQKAKDEFGDLPGDVKPPAKCQILEMSRPISEWPIFKISQTIQAYVYGMTEEQLQETPKPERKAASYAAWFEKTGVKCLWNSANGLEMIFADAYSRRGAVRTKYENRVKKLQKQGKEIPEYEYQAPGVHSNLYGFSQIKPTVKDKASADLLLPRLGNRLDIPKGSPGHIPSHQRGFVNPRRHRIKAFGKAPILGEIVVPYVKDDGTKAEDWLTFDMRGLLRNVRWRFPEARMALTPNKLLAHFTGDPIIDTVRGVLTFSYKAGLVDVRKGQTVNRAGTAKALSGLRSKGPLTLVSIDLGVNNPVAMKVSAISEAGKPEELSRSLLPNRYVGPDGEIAKYKDASDLILHECREGAIASLPAAQQAEVRYVDSTSAQTAKNELANALEIPIGQIAWGKMNDRSTLIGDWLKANGHKDKAEWTGKDGVSKPKYDSRFARDFKGSLSKDTNLALLTATWEAQRNHPGFQKQSKRKEQMARQIANEIVSYASSLSAPGARVALAVEDLEMKGQFLDGRGTRRGSGWERFFTPKAENRWFMKALHKALTDLAKWRGITVCEVNPARTSQTCPSCGHCDKDNRQSGTENFVCLACGICLNADLEVATDNIERVALTGLAMPKPQISSTSVGSTTKVKKTSKKAAISSTLVKNRIQEVLELEKINKNNEVQESGAQTSVAPFVWNGVLERPSVAARIY